MQALVTKYTNRVRLCLCRDRSEDFGQSHPIHADQIAQKVSQETEERNAKTHAQQQGVALVHSSAPSAVSRSDLTLAANRRRTHPGVETEADPQAEPPSGFFDDSEVQAQPSTPVAHTSVVGVHSPPPPITTTHDSTIPCTAHHPLPHSLNSIPSPPPPAGHVDCAQLRRSRPGDTGHPPGAVEEDKRSPFQIPKIPHSCCPLCVLSAAAKVFLRHSLIQT